MALYIKSNLAAYTRNPGVTSNSQILYKLLSSREIDDQATIINLCNAFLKDSGVNVKNDSDEFKEDGTIDTSYLYSEFKYQPYVNSLDRNTTFLAPDENGYNEFIDTSVQVGKFLYDGNLISESDAQQTAVNYSFSARIYDSVYLNRYFYNLASAKCFNQYRMKGQTARLNTIYINYSRARLVSFNIAPDDGSEPYILNVVFIDESSQEYQEDFEGLLSGSPLYLKAIEIFFPFIILKENLAIHGDVYTSFNSLEGEIVYDLNNYVKITEFEFEAPTTNTIACEISEDGNGDPFRTGYALISYNGALIQNFDSQICGSTAATKFIHIIPTSDESLYLYKNFTSSQPTYLMDVYAYNVRYIDYRRIENNADAYYLFQDIGSVASATVKFSSQQVDFAKYSSIKEDTLEGVSKIGVSFTAYASSRTESGALRYELSIPVYVYIPLVVGIEIRGNSAIITTNYATHVSYYFGESVSSEASVAVTNDTADGSGQTTTISIAGQTQVLKIRAYNYFYTLTDLASRGFYITEYSEVSLNVASSIPSLSFEVRTNSVAQTIYDIAGSSATSISFTDLTQVSISSYYLLASYSAVTDFVFIFTFTLNAGDSLVLVVGTESYILTSGVGVSISRQKLFSYSDNDGNLRIRLLLNERTPFDIPFQFKSTSSNAPQVSSVSAPKLNLTSEGKASLEFSFSHQYSRYLSYSVNNGSEDVYNVTLPYSGYIELQPYFSAGAIRDMPVKTEPFEVGSDPDSLVVVAQSKNFDSNGEEVLSSTASSSSVLIPKRLNPNSPAKFLFYEDSNKTIPATKIVKGVTYYAFLQLVGLAGNYIDKNDYGDYIDISDGSINVRAIESPGDGIDLENVSVTYLENYLYSFNIGSDSPFNDTQFSIEATFNSIID